MNCTEDCLRAPSSGLPVMEREGRTGGLQRPPNLGSAIFVVRFGLGLGLVDIALEREFSGDAVFFPKGEGARKGEEGRKGEAGMAFVARKDQI